MTIRSPCPPDVRQALHLLLAQAVEVGIGECVPRLDIVEGGSLTRAPRFRLGGNSLLDAVTNDANGF